MYTSTWSSRSVVPSYFSIVKFFQLEEKISSMMLGTKGFLNRNTYLPKVLRNGEIASKRTLILVALGKQTKVDLASPPSSRLTLGFRDLCVSRGWAFSY